jgi:uncharacterized membrane protein
LNEIKLIQSKIDTSGYQPTLNIDEGPPVSKMTAITPVITEIVQQIEMPKQEAKIESVFMAEAKEVVTIQQEETPLINQNLQSKIDKIIEEKSNTPPPIRNTYENIQVNLEPSFWDNFKEKNPDMEKFIGENLILKIGILILVLGISFFVKYSIDQDWINEVGRIGIGILCGVILLGFSHFLHKDYKAFSSVLVAGAITVFYFTIAYGYHQYHLYSQTVSFGIMVFITLFSTLISVYYDRKELAALSVIGGFAVPFMVSNGDGNYIALFSYLMILNVGMLLLSYFKQWDIVKIMSFAFTYIIFCFWYSSRYYAIAGVAHNNTFLFINAFYLIFLIMNMVDILKNRSTNFSIKVGFLMLNTAITYFISMDILSSYYENFKGLYTLLFALINLTSTFLVYKYNQEQKHIIYFMLGLTLLFATIAIPIQFDGYYVTIFWAAEAFLLLWISYKSDQNAFFTTSIIVYLLCFISLVLDWGHYNSGLSYPIILNSIFLTGLVVNISIYAACYLLRRHTYKLPFMDQDKFDSNIFLVIGVIVSYLIGMLEVQYQSQQYYSQLYSSHSLLMCYHYIFTTVGILYFARFSDNRYLFVLFFSLINIILFIFYNAYRPFHEMEFAISNQQASTLAFYANFVYLVCILLSIAVLIKRYKDLSQLYVFERRYLIAGLLIFIVFLFSNQLLLYFMHAKIQYILPYQAEHIALKYQLFKVLYPIIWGVLSLTYLAYGIRNKNRPVRIISLSLLSITVLKLFLYDIKNVSEGGRILAFILLGVLILIMSFMYQKIKKIILDDTSKHEN